MSEPVVIVYPTVMDGTVVRWYSSARAAEYGSEIASASRHGVCVDMAPRAVAMAAYDVYDELKANERGGHVRAGYPSADVQGSGRPDRLRGVPVTLSYTPLRHKMLAAIRRGRVSSKPGIGWRFQGVPPSSKSQMSRTCGDFYDAKLYDLGGCSAITALNRDGLALLTSWDAQYGEVKPVTDDLASRLSETLDEAERVAREAGGDDVVGQWHLGILGQGDDESVRDAMGAPIIWSGDTSDTEQRAHIVRNDPFSVLRLVAAHRKIIAKHPPYLCSDSAVTGVQHRCHACASRVAYGNGVAMMEPWPCPTLRDVAEGWGLS